MINKLFLQIKSKLYISTILFICIISIPFQKRCNSPQDENARQQHIKDSITAYKQDSAAIAKAKEDSVAAAIIENARQDSINRARIDSTREANKKLLDSVRPQHQYCKYGVYRNDYKH